MSEKRVPHNTSREAEEHPENILRESMIFGVGDAIVRQEAQGQHSFVTSDTLPTKMDAGPWSKSDAKVILEAAGVRFIGPIEGDSLFQYVELPAGWTKMRTEHAMHSRLLDAHGRERATIFYKAAHYDRRADLFLSCRYRVIFDYDRFEHNDQVGVAQIMDGETCLYEVEIPAQGKPQYQIIEESRQAAFTWLDKHYPEWRNPAAYWEVDEPCL
jgi:hypothetical protein